MLLHEHTKFCTVCKFTKSKNETLPVYKYCMISKSADGILAKQKPCWSGLRSHHLGQCGIALHADSLVRIILNLAWHNQRAQLLVINNILGLGRRGGLLHLHIVVGSNSSNSDATADSIEKGNLQLKK